MLFETWHLLYILIFADWFWQFVQTLLLSRLFPKNEIELPSTHSSAYDAVLSLFLRYNRKAGFVPSMYLQQYNNPRIRMMPAQREMTSSTLDLAQLQHPGDNSLHASGRELSKSQGNLRLPPGSTLDLRDKQMSRSMGRLPDARSTQLTPPSIRVQFAENSQQSSLSEDSEDFSDESSFSGTDSLNRSDAEERFRRSRTPTLDSSGSLSPESPTEGKMIGSRSDPSLNKMPSTPKVPPRPQAQEILKRCTTVTRKNLQRTS